MDSVSNSPVGINQVPPVLATVVGVVTDQLSPSLALGSLGNTYHHLQQTQQRQGESHSHFASSSS